MSHDLFTLLAIVAGGAAIPLVARRYQMPTAVVEILYGSVLFHTLLHEKPAWLDFLQEVGFVYLMFTVGMELDLRVLLKTPRWKWFLLSPLISFVFLPLFAYLLGLPAFLGVAVSMVSAGIAIPVLKEMNLNQTDFGFSAIAMALTGELLSIAVLTGLDLYHRSGLSLLFLIELLKLTVFLLAAGLGLKLIYLFAWWYPGKVERIMESQDPVEEGIRFVLAIAFAGAVLAGLAGVDAILGAFMAGTIFNHIFTYKGVFHEKVDAIGYGFLIPLFFIGIGADFNPLFLLEPFNGKMVLILLAMLLPAHLYPILLNKPLGFRFRESLSVSLLLSAPLTLLIAAGEIGLRLGMLSPSQKSALVANAVIAGLLFPFLFRKWGLPDIHGRAEPNRDHRKGRSDPSGIDGSCRGG